MLINSTTLTAWQGEPLPLGDDFIQHPLNIEDLRREDGEFAWSDADLAEWNLYRPIPFETPEGKQRVGFASYVFEDGQVQETYEVEDIPVATVTPIPTGFVMREAIINRLDAAGKTAALLSHLQANPLRYFRWFSGSSIVPVDDTETIAILTAIGADPDAILGAV